MDWSERGHKCGLYVSLRGGTQLDVTKTQEPLRSYCLGLDGMTGWLTVVALYVFLLKYHLVYFFSSLVLYFIYIN